MHGYDAATGPTAGRWQYGELVQSRAPTRTSGAFYGALTTAQQAVTDGGESDR